jgi:hypothetical protein
MKPIDIRNANFHNLRAQLDVRRAHVLGLLALHGPCTTRELSLLTAEDILSIRPRVTELVQIGLAVLHDRENGQGVYRVALQSEWEQWHEKQMEGTITAQMQLV